MFERMCVLVAAFSAALSLGDSAASAAQADGLSWEALVDTYYAWDGNRPADGNRAYTTQPLRHNDFNLNLGLLQARYHDDQFRGHLGLQTGTYVAANLAAEPALLKNVFAASAGVRLWDQIWLDAGVFPSHIGFEGIVSADNWNSSRSLVAEYSPYYESGLKVSGTWDSLSAAVLVLNGWQNIQDTNSGKALGTQLSWQALDTLLLNWSSFVGNEAPDTSAAQWRFFNNFYAVYSPLPQWDLAATVDVGLQQRPNHAAGAATWLGTALITRYRFDAHWSLGGRLETFSDPEQAIVATATANGFQVGGASLNLDYAWNQQVLGRLEGRVFSSRDALYPTAVKDQLAPLDAMLVASLTVRFGSAQAAVPQEVAHVGF